MKQYLSRKSFLVMLVVLLAVAFLLVVLLRQKTTTDQVNSPNKIEISGQGSQIPNKARTLTYQELLNAIAFTKAMNYIKFFHPSDEAATADWNRLASEGMQFVEDAKNTFELSSKLLAFFASYAPTVQFLAPGEVQKYLPNPATAKSRSKFYQVRWLHHGVGLSDRQPVYSSNREYLPLSETLSVPWNLTVKAEGDTFHANEFDIGSGLKICLPIVVPADKNRNTIPKTGTRNLSKNSFPLSGDDRYVRMGNIALAWGVIQHFFPYFDVVECDWDAELGRALMSASNDVDAESFVHTLSRMTAPLKDSHVSVQMGSAYEKIFQPLNFFGINVNPSKTFSDLAFPSIKLAVINGNLYVKYADGDAKHIPHGSRILAIDGERIEQIATRFKLETSAATETWLHYRFAYDVLYGKKDTPVNFEVQTPDGLRKDISLIRNIDYRTFLTNYPARESSKTVFEIQPGIWYVNVAGDADIKYFESILPKLASAKGVIFDYRTYPRSHMAVSVLRYLHNEIMLSAWMEKPLISEPDRTNWNWFASRWGIAPASPQITCKKVFLTGGGAVSYSETCLEFVEAYRLGEIIGEQTAGSNGSVNFIELPGGYTVTFTGMRVLKHNKSTHHGIGIRPTIQVVPTVRGLIEERDEVLEKALEVLMRE